MSRLIFSVDIRASSKNICSILCEDDTYRSWISVFSPGLMPNPTGRKAVPYVFWPPPAKACTAQSPE